MKKQFDISMRPQIESGEYKVVTNDDHPVRICCWDAENESDWPIVALVKDYNEKSDYCYPVMCDINGKVATRGCQKNLFVVTPEPELTEFEKACKIMMTNWCESDDLAIGNDFVREEAAKLEEIAKKWFAPKYDATKVDEKLINTMVERRATCWTTDREMSLYRDGLIDMYKQFAEELDVAFKHQDEVIFDNGYDKGRKDANESIPKWERMDVQAYGEMLANLDSPFIAGMGLHLKCYRIGIQELFDKLPKEE